MWRKENIYSLYYCSTVLQTGPVIMKVHVEVFQKTKNIFHSEISSIILLWELLRGERDNQGGCSLPMVAVFSMCLLDSVHALAHAFPVNKLRSFAGKIFQSVALRLFLIKVVLQYIKIWEECTLSVVVDSKSVH